MMKLLFAAIALAVLASACSGDGSKPSTTETPAAPASLSPPVTASATPPSGPARTPAPTEGAAAALYPRGTRTGVAGVDAFIAAVENSDAAALQALLRYTPVPCATTGYPRPVCPAGVAEGTPVETLYNGRCDAGWYIDADVIRRYVDGEFVAFAVARLPTPARPNEQGGYPAGDYLVVMEDRRGPTGEPRGAIIAGDGVVALFTGCFSVSPRQFLDDHVHVYSASTAAYSFLLPPR